MTARRTLHDAGRWLAGLFALCLLWPPALTAQASGTRDLEEGRRLSLQLELEAALASFQLALDSRELTRTQLIELLAERAFIYHALADTDALVEDFVWLSALAPDYRLDLRAPPDLRAIWTATRDQGRGPLRIMLHAERRESGEVLAHAALTGTIPPGATPRLFVRTGAEPFRALAEPTLREPTKGAAHDFYAEAVGLGGVVIARAYSPEAPLHVAASVPRAQAPEPLVVPVHAAPTATDHGHRRRVRNWMIGTASLLVGAAAVTAVLLVRAREQDRSEPTLKPVVSF